MIIVKCDRCGKTHEPRLTIQDAISHFIITYWTFNDVPISIAPKDWSTIHEKDLCDKCTRDYKNNLDFKFNNFMKGGKL